MDIAASAPAKVQHQATPPRWARLAAHAAVVTTLPSGLWRIAMALGIPVGFSPEVLRSLYNVPGPGSVTIIAISVAQECLALLTLGLVRPWGEVVPRWIPYLGGRPVPPRAAVIPAALGALALTLIMFSQLAIWGNVDHGPISDAGRQIMGLCYLPLLLWGPLLGAVTFSYYRRHPRRDICPVATVD